MKNLFVLCFLLLVSACDKPKLSDSYIYGDWQISSFESVIGNGSSTTNEIAESQVYHFLASGKCMQVNTLLNSHDTNFYIVNPENKTINFINEENELGAFFKVNVVSESEMEWIMDLGDENGKTIIELERI